MENLPVVLLEALSAGVPVLAGRVGGIPEVFDAGVEGDFWLLDDVHKACDALLGMLDDEQRRRAMAEAAMRRFERCFDAEVVAKRLYEGLLSLRAH
jgi:glycosyltransferase involved in cell wall biosynthesis